MIEPGQDHGMQQPETIEDLSPRENESEGLKGGVSQENAHPGSEGGGRSGHEGGGL
jgi:hypothetical protein